MIVDGERLSGPYVTDGVQDDFTFDFKVFAASDLVVQVGDDNLTLTTDYTVSLNEDQDSNPGGTVTLLTPEAYDGPDLYVSGSAMPCTQSNQFTNTGGFYPSVLNAALDRLTILLQQQRDLNARALLAPLGETGATLPVGMGATLFDDLNTLANISDDIAIAAANVSAIIAAPDAATAAALSAVEAAASETAALAYETAAMLAAGVSGHEATYALLVAHIANYANGNNILVDADETHFGEASIYTKTAGVAMYVRAAGLSAQYDHLSRPVIPGRLTDKRSLGLHIRKAHDDFRSGARLYAMGFVVSDSLGLIDYPGGPAQWAAIEAGHFKNGPALYGDNSTSYLDPKPSSGQLVTGKFTCTQNFKTDFTKAWVGCTQSFTAGQYCCYSGATDGSGRLCDYIRIPLYKLPSAGVFKIQISNAALCPAVGGAWVDPVVGQIASAHSLTGSELLVDVNAAAGMNIVELAVALGQWHVKVTLVSGTGTAIVPAFEVHSKSAINIYRLSAGSNDFSSESSAANPHMAALIANLRPDWVYVGADDTLPAFQNFLPMLDTALTSAALTFKPLVMVEGNAYSPIETAIASRIDWCKDYVSSKLGWVVVDLLATIGGLAETTREGVQGDGIHPYSTNPIAYSAGWRAWAASHDLLARSYTGLASYADMARNIGGRVVTSTSIMGAMMSPARFDTATMTWSKLASSSAGTSVTRTDDAALTITTTATANDKVTAYVNEARPIFGPSNGTRSLANEGGMGFAVMPLVANATGVARIVWRAISYNAPHAGTLAQLGFGVIIENLTLTLIGWDGTTEVRSASSATLAVNRADDVVIVIYPAATVGAVTSLVEAFVNGISLGTVSVRNNGNLIALRCEMTNGATAAAYSLKITPPILVNARG